MEANPVERIKELKSSLGAYLKTFRSEYLLAVKEYLEEIYLAEGLKEIGCDGKCKGCFLAFEEGWQAASQCKMWALYSALSGIDIKETKNPRIIDLSKQLLEALNQKK